MSEMSDVVLEKVPDSEDALYVNDPEIVDETAHKSPRTGGDTDEEDNVRVYVPMDLNEAAVLRRLRFIGSSLGTPSEYNEFQYSTEVLRVVFQLEIYDEAWRLREKDPSDGPGSHSRNGMDLAEKVLDVLSGWGEESWAECFPYETINDLEEEYGISREHDWQ